MMFILEKINKDNKYILDNLLELYQHEFNKFYNYYDDLNDDGKYGFILTDKYITNTNYRAYLIKANAKIAGFIMINSETKFVRNGIYIAEFFVMPKYRRGYFSINVMKEIFRQNQGNIEIKVLKNNKKAFKLYSLLINRFVDKVVIHKVQEEGDEFIYYNFSTKNIKTKL